MTIEFLTIAAIVAVLSVVQSIFGMGILVFGTPTLLLLGYDFATTLCYLLPASCAISLLQVLTAGSSRVPVSRYLYFLCLPGIGVGLWLTKLNFLAPWINALVGATLLLTAVVRIWPLSQRALGVFLHKYLPFYQLSMGLVHGLTNLGGGLLAVLASGAHTEKAAIRYTVAHYYLAFSVIQMLVLALALDQSEKLIGNAGMSIVSTLVYLLVGNRLFALTSNRSYNVALTVFIAVYGVAILFKL